MKQELYELRDTEPHARAGREDEDGDGFRKEHKQRQFKVLCDSASPRCAGRVQRRTKTTREVKEAMMTWRVRV